MQCPYFKKINFQRIQQRVDADQEFERSEQAEKTKNSRNSDIEAQQQQIPEEGFTNYIKIQQYKNVGRHESFHMQQKQMQEIDRIITIKMPKALRTKQLNIQENICQNLDEQIYVKTAKNQKYQNMTNLIKQTQEAYEQDLSQIEEQISFQQIQKKQKSAQIFSTKRNFSFQISFYSVVMLPKTNQYCFCQLDQCVLKIISIGKDINQNSPQLQATQNQIKKKTNNSYQFQNSKIKYFIQLKKYKLQFITITSHVLQISVNCKYNKESFRMQFMSQKQRCTFQYVYFLTINQLKEMGGVQAQSKIRISNKNQQQCSVNTAKKQEPSLISQRSVDSLRFSVERMACEKAKNFLDTFDLILFKGKNIFCKVQRFFTNSSFDHVALVIKASKSNLLLLQSTGNVGVAIYSFSSVEMALEKNIYERVAIRKFSNLNQFNISQRAKKLIALQQFVQQANGKKYKFDPLYLISSSVKNNKGSNGKLAEQTYFCSELVAQALKACGILKDIKPSYKYLPKHFGDRESLNCQLMPGCYYSDEIILQR